MLGLGSVSERTLRRMAEGGGDRGMAGCIDGRWLPAAAGHPSITEQVREAIFAVREETRHRSRMSMTDKHVLVGQYVREKFGGRRPGPVLLGRCGRCGGSGSGRAGPGSAMTVRPAAVEAARGTWWCTGPARSSRWTPRCCR